MHKSWIIGLDRLMFIVECRALIQTTVRFSWLAYALEALPWYGGKARHNLTLRSMVKFFLSGANLFLQLKRNSIH